MNRQIRVAILSTGLSLILLAGTANCQDRLLPPLRPAAEPPAEPWQPAREPSKFEASALTLADQPATALADQPATALADHPAMELADQSATTTPPRAHPRSARPPRIHTPASTGQNTRPIPVVNQQSGSNSSLQPAAYQFQTTSNDRSQRVMPETSRAKHLVEELRLSARSVIDNFQPMGLHDMLANCRGDQRKAMIRQYWSTWQACSEYQFAVDELSWLEQVGQPRNESERLVLQAARSMVGDAMIEKRLLMTKAQQDLNRFLTGPVSETLPWPTDSPLVGQYDTHYGAYAARGSGTPRLQSIDRQIPQLRELIDSRARTVERCRDAILQSTQNYRQTGGSSATMLQALYLSRECHAAFLRTVADYNRNIAEYALSVKPRQSGAEQVVSMLIPASTIRQPDSNSLTDPGLRQAALPDTNPWQSPSRDYEYQQPPPNSGYAPATDNRYELPNQRITGSPQSAYQTPAALGDQRARGFQGSVPAARAPQIQPADRFPLTNPSTFQPSVTPAGPPQAPSGFRR